MMQWKVLAAGLVAGAIWAAAPAAAAPLGPQSGVKAAADGLSPITEVKHRKYWRRHAGVKVWRKHAWHKHARRQAWVNRRHHRRTFIADGWYGRPVYRPHHRRIWLADPWYGPPIVYVPRRRIIYYYYDPYWD